MPKGPVFYKPPEDEGTDSEEEAIAMQNNPNLDFNNILGRFGGDGMFSSGAESADEEEKKGGLERLAASRAGVRVFRPNLSASHPFREDSAAASH